MPLEWDLYRHFLAVARRGSLSAAARELGDSQPTVARRVGRLERELGARLFSRTRRGLVPTAAGEALVEAASRMEREAEVADRLVRGRDAGIAGRVRVSASEGLAVTWLVPRLRELERRAPDLSVEIRVDNAPLDLGRGQADVALRLNPASRGDLVGKRVATLGFGLYAARAYLALHGTPRTLEDLRAHRLVRVFGPAATHPLYEWFSRLAPEASRGVGCDSLLGHLACVRAGHGVGFLSCVSASDAPDLVRVLPKVGRAPDLWVVTHADARRTPRIRAMVEFLVEIAKRDRELLARGG